MQAPTTLTRGNRFNRLTAGAIGLALLAAATIGAVVIENDIELPLLGSNSSIESPSAVNPQAEMLLIEQNSYDYAAVEPIDTLFLEENTWDYPSAASDASVDSILFIEQNSFDYQPVATYATVESIRFVEENSFDYVSPAAVEYIHFIEDNSWDWAERAQLAGEESAPAAAPDHRFIEENTWDSDHLVHPEDDGSTDY